MDVAVPEDTGQDPALEVEQCTCPPGYRGPSCQVSPGPHTPVQPAPSMVLPGSSTFSSFHLPKPTPAPPPSGRCPEWGLLRKPLPLPSSCPQDCDTGYTRMPSGLYLGTCERCSCHGHTEVCEPETGACQVSPTTLTTPGICSPGGPSLNHTLSFRIASTTQLALGVSSASRDTTGTPSKGHHRTASHAHAMEPPLLASTFNACLSLPFPEMSTAPSTEEVFASSQALWKDSG